MNDIGNGSFPHDNRATNCYTNDKTQVQIDIEANNLSKTEGKRSIDEPYEPSCKRTRTDGRLHFI